MKTMQEIKSLSWKQLNLALAELLYGCDNVVNSQYGATVHLGGQPSFKFDYMDYSLIMPHFFNLKTAVIYDSFHSAWEARASKVGAVSVSESPQRAITEVLVYVMQEQSK